MPEGQKDHEGVAVAIAIGLGRLDQSLDLVDGQVLACPQDAILCPTRRNYSIFSYWRDQTQAWFGHEKSPSRSPHCSIHKHFMNSCKRTRRRPLSVKRRHPLQSATLANEE
jgi:hypothetical protein